ncbi:unnamed protein product [Symbiodinium natans]|uniref:Exostosin GT47 domain-containing protein n=1 Tax=Symbiodinium natans TaxID=878477 RepID=A0A812RZE5_9DINO|nr:unnamed protein product [Symbiodinium natans]
MIGRPWHRSFRDCAVLGLLCRNAGEFIEDFYASSVKPTFGMLVGGATRAPTGLAPTGDPDKDLSLVMAHVPKTAFHDSIALDFKAAARSWRGAKGLEDSVKIYVHPVPNCAGEELLDLFTSQNSGFGWTRAVQLHALHIKAVHDAIMRSPARVEDPKEATVFYIPAFYSLLVERYIDLTERNEVAVLNCMSNSWSMLREEFWHRNAGYDHFISAGTCHPYSVCAALECDVTNFHPFAVNVFALVGGVRQIGHPDFAFTPGKGFQMLRTVIVPFPVTLDCERLLQLSKPDRARSIDVAFVGTENSRVRQIFRELMEDTSLPYSRNPRFHIRVLPDDDVGEWARKMALDSESDESGMRSIDEIYSNSQFCLVLPGHMYDLGRRAFDAMARACILVIVAMEPMFVSVPFTWQIPWEEFAIFSAIRNVEDAGRLIDTLSTAAQEESGRAAISARRQAMLKHLPHLFLPPHKNCLPGTPTATDGILREIAVRQAAWAAMSTVRSPSWHLAGQLTV